MRAGYVPFVNIGTEMHISVATTAIHLYMNTIKVLKEDVNVIDR